MDRSFFFGSKQSNLCERDITDTHESVAKQVRGELGAVIRINLKGDRRQGETDAYPRQRPKESPAAPSIGESWHTACSSGGMSWTGRERRELLQRAPAPAGSRGRNRLPTARAAALAQRLSQSC